MSEQPQPALFTLKRRTPDEAIAYLQEQVALKIAALSLVECRSRRYEGALRTIAGSKYSHIFWEAKGKPGNPADFAQDVLDEVAKELPLPAGALCP